jgi:hypothetical protein
MATTKNFPDIFLMKQCAHMMTSPLTASHFDTRVFGLDQVVDVLHKMNLALASNTQFVDRGVKDVAMVGDTGRKEEQRSAYAIIRSSNLLLKEITRDTHAPNKINALLQSGEEAVASALR